MILRKEELMSSTGRRAQGLFSSELFKHQDKDAHSLFFKFFTVLNKSTNLLQTEEHIP